MPGPIRPEQVAEAKRKQIPEEVFEAFNELIVKDWDGRGATVLQKAVVPVILAKFKGRVPKVTYQTLLDEGWLDVEDSYMKAGWKVTYDKPGYNETYDPSFRFERK